MVKKSDIPAPRLAMLRSYFYSGWAFLMPYLFVYLLYYVMKGPVNPVGKTQNPELQISNSWVPCMLHVYWALHAIHVLLAGVALWSWWKHFRAKIQTPSAKCQGSSAHACLNDTETQRAPADPTAPDSWLLTPLILRLLPWLLLALLFYIPGVYLEWPSDPWEHLRRINEWRILDTVGAHSSWMKSAYFIPYSLLSWCIGLRQLFWLDFYYTGICLLLCWQYYRFSRACGLGDRASMVFVIIQALLFGNNIFSFYRYYGISSSIYAQLGAVALTRIVLQFAARGTKIDPVLQEQSEVGRGVPAEPGSESNNILQKETKLTKNAGRPLAHGSDTPTSIVASPAQGAPGCCHPAPSLRANRLTQTARFTISALPCSVNLFIAVTCLLSLTAMNHPQGLGIAGLGIAAIIVWRLIEWKRSALWWLIGGTLVINALFLAFYPRPPIIETYRTQGYLNACYGFNILDLTSPAGDRMMQIVGFLGLFNIAAAFILLRRNHLIAWMTIVSFFVISLPLFAVPFATMAYKTAGESNIITFQRLFFSMPAFFALVAICGPHWGLVGPSDQPSIETCNNNWRGHSILALTIVLLALAASTLISPAGPFYARTWQAMANTPADLQRRNLAAAADSLALKQTHEQQIITSLSVGPPLHDLGVPNIQLSWRAPPGSPESDLISVAVQVIRTEKFKGEAFIFAPSYSSLFTQYSLAGLLSTHWPPQQVACDNGGGCELISETVRRGGVDSSPTYGELYLLHPSKTP